MGDYEQASTPFCHSARNCLPLLATYRGLLHSTRSRLTLLYQRQAKPLGSPLFAAGIIAVATEPLTDTNATGMEPRRLLRPSRKVVPDASYSIMITSSLSSHGAVRPHATAMKSRLMPNGMATIQNTKKTGCLKQVELLFTHLSLDKKWSLGATSKFCN